MNASGCAQRAVRFQLNALQLVGNLLIGALLLTGGGFVTAQAQQTCTPPEHRPYSRYVFLGNGAEVQDTVTGLIWQRCVVGMTWDGSTCTGNPTGLNWDQASNFAANLDPSNLDTGAAARWRLPALPDLLTLADPACKQPSINSRAFPNTPPYVVWASNDGFSNLAADNAKCLYFGDAAQSAGQGSTTCWTGNTQRFRLVRGSRAANKVPVAVIQFPSNTSQSVNQRQAISLSANQSTDPDGFIQSYLWDFGDGTPSIYGRDVTHTYARAGNFRVTLTVTDNHGTQGKGTADINVAAINHQLNYTVEGLAQGQTVKILVNLSTQSAPQTLIATGNGSFPLPQLVPEGSSYQFSVTEQPQAQACSVSDNASGIVSQSGAPSPRVRCINTYAIQGTVSGLALGQVLHLANGANQLQVGGGGAASVDPLSFRFVQRVSAGGAYQVTVERVTHRLDGPIVNGATCTVTNASGTNVSSDITDISVACTNEVGVKVRGLPTGQTFGFSFSGTAQNNETSAEITQLIPTRVTQDGEYWYSPPWRVTKPWTYRVTMTPRNSVDNSTECSPQDSPFFSQVLKLFVCKVKPLDPVVVTNLSPGSSMTLSLMTVTGTVTAIATSDTIIGATPPASTQYSVPDAFMVEGNSTLTFAITTLPPDQRCSITDPVAGVNGIVDGRTSITFTASARRRFEINCERRR